MVKRNPHIKKLKAGYLFPEISKKKANFLKKYPNADLIDLGIGNTTLPLASSIVTSVIKKAKSFGQESGYEGYGPSEGITPLRESVASKIYNHTLSADEIFISDGCKCDIGRLQLLFGKEATIAVQDPSYPVYVDSSVLVGQTGEHLPSTGLYKNMVSMPCRAENGFFPDFSQIKRADILYICSPNNPTGATATKEQLETVVQYAKKNQSIIVFDTAYQAFIRDPQLPKSIYEIEGASDVAIELGSFSKAFGFTGLRLGWSVIPKTLRFTEGHSVRDDWIRLIQTLFNGASLLIQAAGIAALEKEGHAESMRSVAQYMENATLLKEAFQKAGYTTWGGENAPYLWVKTKEKNSWDTFQELLEKKQIVTTPGVGFGPAGEGFIRISAFAKKEKIAEAVRRLKGDISE